MPPSLGCLNISLFCTEEAHGSDWEDEFGSVNEQQHQEQKTLLLHDESALQDVFIISDHLFEEADELVQQLIQKEASFMPQKEYTEFYNGSDGAELQELRERAIHWMLHVQAYYGFNACTVFQSVGYFDRFLAKQQPNLLKKCTPWLVQLLAVGCMSVAAKLEEVEVPLLRDLQVGKVPNVFEARTIQRMELLILSTLEWRLSSVTPFSFLGFLLHQIAVCGQSCSELLSRIEELILNSCRELRFLGYPPSVLAMASVMCACDEMLPRQAAGFRCALLSVWPNRESIIVECASLMQELLFGADPFWTSRRSSTVSPTLSAPDSPSGVLDAPCFSCDSENSFYSSFKFARIEALHCSGAVDCAAFKVAIATAAAAYSISPSPSTQETCNTVKFCRKRKFNERHSNICSRSTPAAEPADTQDDQTH